jgi:hypothetical protein
MFRHLATAALAIALTAPAAHATDSFGPALDAFLAESVLPLSTDAVLIDAIRAQNERNTALAPDAITMLDAAWQAETGAAEQPTISPVVTGAVADFLRAYVEGSGGKVTEAFAMDMKGLNVAASAPTSDYWQGDEDKFTQTFGKGAGASLIGEVEFDDSTQTYQAQISVTVTDPATNAPIGALTVAVNASSLE